MTRHVLATLVISGALAGCFGQPNVGVERAAIHTWNLVPDADGNVSTPGGATEISVQAGDTLVFFGLTSHDNIIEVASPTLTSGELCEDGDLGSDAHPVVAQNPLPPGYYAANELSGPYHTYPAGIHVIGTGTDECRYVEKTTPCVPPNEKQHAVIARPYGGANTVYDYLCYVEPYEMDPDEPNHVRDAPAQRNPNCLRNEMLDSTWSDPAVEGVFLRLAWKDINDAYDHYNWNVLDHELAQAVRYGKTVTIGIRVGGNAIPQWAFDTGDPIQGRVQEIILRDWDTQPSASPDPGCGYTYSVASPSDQAFRILFNRVLDALGAHLREDQRRFSVLAGVKVTGMGMATLENRLPSRCNVARPNPMQGDAIVNHHQQGHLLDIASSSGTTSHFDAAYAGVRINNVADCVCNPQVMENAGYTPTVLKDFYRGVETTLYHNFGYKQQVFMDISDGFPQVGEHGRYWGDHVVGPITTAPSVSPRASAAPQPMVAQIPTDIPASETTTKRLVEDANLGMFAGGAGDPTVGRSFGVENAALGPIGISRLRPTNECLQERDISLVDFPGSAEFPILIGTVVDNSTADACPNFIAAKEGIEYDKAGGFQVGVDQNGVYDIDESLWNMTLNTNGLFFEYYEADHWLVRKQVVWNTGNLLNPNPAVKTRGTRPNDSSATGKTLEDWNNLLLRRSQFFSANPSHANPFQANPFPTSYSVPVLSAPNTDRYYFNSRACQAFYQHGTPVRINHVHYLN